MIFSLKFTIHISIYSICRGLCKGHTDLIFCPSNFHLNFELGFQKICDSTVHNVFLKNNSLFLFYYMILHRYYFTLFRLVSTSWSLENGIYFFLIYNITGYIVVTCSMKHLQAHVLLKKIVHYFSFRLEQSQYRILSIYINHIAMNITN